MNLYELGFLMLAFATLVSMLVAVRGMRDLRWHHEARSVLFAYERELRARGITDLPPRCVMCCQILPRHVDPCPGAQFYNGLDPLTKRLTTPPIKYFPKGEKPPDLGGGHA